MAQKNNRRAKIVGADIEVDITEKKDIIVEEGKVTKLHRGSIFNVRMKNGKIINASLSGKMRTNKIKVIIGDSVAVEFSIHDFTKGRIIHRNIEEKNKKI